jgi:oligoribonuclease NrnB/cAMP/cGMP phosphodiesterase (DHH superfamily)
MHEILTGCQREIVIAEHTVPCANVPYIWSGDAGTFMAMHKPFSACYTDTATHRVFSLRSHKDNPFATDVAKIAELYNGGGHKHASGFKVKRDHPLAKV